MTTPLDIEYFIGQIDLLNEWLIAFPLPREYRERTTYRQFNELVRAKQAELGLTPEVIAQLREVKDDKDLDWAWVEVGMTQDNRELVYENYYLDLPLNFQWMPEYEALRKSVDDFMDTQPRFQGAEEEDKALLEVVRKHMPEVSIAPR